MRWVLWHFSISSRVVRRDTWHDARTCQIFTVEPVDRKMSQSEECQSVICCCGVGELLSRFWHCSKRQNFCLIEKANEKSSTSSRHHLHEFAEKQFDFIFLMRLFSRDFPSFCLSQKVSLNNHLLFLVVFIHPLEHPNDLSKWKKEDRARAVCLADYLWLEEVSPTLKQKEENLCLAYIISFKTWKDSKRWMKVGCWTWTEELSKSPGNVKDGFLVTERFKFAIWSTFGDSFYIFCFFVFLLILMFTPSALLFYSFWHEASEVMGLKELRPSLCRLIEIQRSFQQLLLSQSCDCLRFLIVNYVTFCSLSLKGKTNFFNWNLVSTS